MGSWLAKLRKYGKKSNDETLKDGGTKPSGTKSADSESEIDKLKRQRREKKQAAQTDATELPERIDLLEEEENPKASTCITKQYQSHTKLFSPSSSRALTPRKSACEPMFFQDLDDGVETYVADKSKL